MDRALRPPRAVLGSKFLSASLPRPNPTRRVSWPFSPSAMAQQRRVALIVAAVAATMLRSTVFVPAPAGKPSAPAAACAAAVLGAAGNAHADAIGDAAAKLSKAAYPFMKEVP